MGFWFKYGNEKSDMRLSSLIKLKKKIISKVQETETFNDAKAILEKYDPSALRNLSASLTNLSVIDGETPSRRPRFNTHLSASQQFTSKRPSSMDRRSYNSPLLTPSYSNNRSLAANQMPPPTNTVMPSSKTVKPVLAQNRSILEKIVDSVFQDGPSNRYALICRKCFEHNGMALPEEFEYISYICAYCKTFNPARKIKPPISSDSQSNYVPSQNNQLKAIEEPKKQDDVPSSSLEIKELSSELNKTVIKEVSKFSFVSFANTFLGSL